MGDDWTRIFRGLRWRIESTDVHDVHRDRGPRLCIGSEDANREWLRFDCSAADPHWVLDPDGRNESQSLDELGLATQETFDRIRRELPALLERAGAPAELYDSLAADLESEAGRVLLRDAERAMRHRPALLDDLDVRWLENRRSEKWHTYPRDILPAWVAEMDFPVAAPIHDESPSWRPSRRPGSSASPRRGPSRRERRRTCAPARPARSPAAGSRPGAHR
jgi:hypothetical protein